MQSIKRDLAIGLCLCAFVFTSALIWGSPFVGASSGAREDQAQNPQPAPQDPGRPPSAQAPQDQPQQQPQSSTFTGTIIKSGNQYGLRDTSGQIYQLDDPESARHYVGKSVKVTGELDQQAKLIHVQSIEGIAA
ncbi:MAG TPA: DUF5818 domain-containing protein [Terracidiphilus sp.]|jgi:uncharacterized protein YdeI (BOF family)|nr:DUF5818 domain-containing protein [Terracidiphilus sp.]